MLHDFFGRPQFHQSSLVHDTNAITEIGHQVQVMGDEQICQSQLLFKIQQEVDDLGLDGDIEVGDRLIQY